MTLRPSLRQEGADPEVIEYHKTPTERDELKALYERGR
jgi:arsenate reductase-like glutaredoxin family protein